MSLSTRALVGGLLIALSSPALADDKAACIAAAETGQDLRSEGKLQSARERFVECSRANCPDAIRQDCARFLTEIEQSLPSIVISAVDDKGADLVGARALLDGKETKLDGKAVVVDPGKHVVRIEPKSGAAAQTDLVVAEGEKNRTVRVVVAAPKTAPIETLAEHPSPSVAAYVIGGAGVLVLAGSLYYGFAARHDIADMRKNCAPYCNSDDVDDKKRALLFADIGVGVGVVAVGVAAYMIAFPSRSTPPTSAVGAAYVPSGALVQWSSVF